MAELLPPQDALAEVVRNMAEGIVVTDAAGHFTFVNPACAHLLGHDDPAELIGKRWISYVAQECRPRVEAVDACPVPGVADHYEVDLVRLDGTRRTVLVSGSPQFAGGQYTGTVTVFTDVTERKQAEAAASALALENARLIRDARQRAAELEAVRRAALGLTAHLDLEAVLSAILEAALKLLPEASDAHIFLYRNDELSFGAVLFSGGRRGQAVAIPRRNGLTHTVARLGEMLVVSDMRSHPLFSDAPPEWQGGIIGLPLKIGQRVVGVMNVATKKPHTWPDSDLRVLYLLGDQAAVAIENACLHDEIRLHASQLEQRVAERTAELQAANTSLRNAAGKLRELDRMKSEFLSNVSHELRTPLSNIKLYLDLLEDGKPGKTAHYMATLHREANLLQSLIEDLLHISRIDLGKVRPALHPVEINALVANLVSDRTALAASRGLVIAVQTAERLPRVMADPRMLIQVLSNIITNALNYTPSGGHVTVLTGIAERDGQMWDTVAVRDTGRGIPAEDLPHVFERFYRGVAARDAREPGTGLGLAISQELIHCQGGKITVDSQVGCGSTFVVWLPVAVDGGLLI